MRQVILLLFLASIVCSQPHSWADYDKNSISSADLASPPGKTPKLYGRIEQIVQSPGAQFPIVLKAQTAKMDTSRQIKLEQRAEANFSGALVKSFPQQFSGTWGGSLKIWTSQLDPICWQIDSDEANRMKQLLTSQREGTVNFNFTQSAGGTIALEPAQVTFMVPIKDTRMHDEMSKMIGSGAGSNGLTMPGMDANQMSGMMQQMMNNMSVPIIICFGAINRTDVEGVSGNAIRAEVLKNSIRQLSPGVLEQQIVTQETQHNNKTGTTRTEYAETVIRFTRQGNNSLYVLAAAVNYTANRQFERKLVLYGTVTKGQVMPDMSNPLGILNNMMPANQKLPPMSPGQNPFQNLFPH